MITDKSCILVTGANGFIGRRLVARLVADGHTVRAAQRGGGEIEGAEIIEIPDFATYTDWKAALSGVQSVIHVAGIINSAAERDPRSDMMRVNRDLTKVLAEQSVAHGVRRFVFLSSMSIYGPQPSDTILRPDTNVKPDGPYPESKYAGEQVVETTMAGTNTGFIHVRPPMVLGQGTRGTFYSMARALAKVRVSPFGRFKAPYPIVQLDTLCKAITTLATHPDVEDGVYLPQDLGQHCLPSIIDLVATLDERKPPGHLPIPRFIVRLLMKAVGRGEIFHHVTAGLQISDPRMEALAKQ